MPCPVSALPWWAESLSPPLTPQQGVPSYSLILKNRLIEHSYSLPLLWIVNKTKQKNKHKQGAFLCLDLVPNNVQASQPRDVPPLYIILGIS